MPWSPHNVSWACAVAIRAKAAGDVLEAGVFRGASFRHLLRSRPSTAHAWGVDSFRGMGKPGKHDHAPNGASPYPEGKFDVGGAALLREELRGAGYKGFTLVEGYVPEVLGRLGQIRRLAVAYLDLDHYRPTLFAARWIWDRLSPGGVILFDDFLSTQRDRLATRAAVEFMRSRPSRINVLWPPGNPPHQVAVQKRMERHARRP